MVDCKVLGGDPQDVNYINCHGCVDECESCKIPGIIIEDGCLCGDCAREVGCVFKPSHSCSLFCDLNDPADIEEDHYEKKERERKTFGRQCDEWVTGGHGQ